MKSPPRWRVAAQQRHVLVEERDGGAMLTGCGFLVWPNAYDARMVDPPICITCRYLYSEDDTGRADVRSP
ncbi:hypothetical protein SAMN05421810_101882 [Amycolatopsis arida]|uniref:Zinc-finger n=1 Tax=Amycolatopsis arida TaxID=587909 RepID=A0A1I5MDF9_9PSEU|nr:hypothetical protein [Amycolatopsis arida]TDX94056.1 hypothetical protein CLV69_104514 [Amycolatopsis arida]SFP07563.1 hypothetical protein SAMN05421810_101882 [Amycolatopsis arida]